MRARSPRQRGVPDRAGRRRRGRLRARRRARRRAARRGAARPVVPAAAGRGRDLRGEDRPPPTASSTGRSPAESLNVIRALSPHIGARGRDATAAAQCGGAGARGGSRSWSTAWSCSRCSRRAAGAWTGAEFLRGTAGEASRPPAGRPSTSSCASPRRGPTPTARSRAPSPASTTRERAFAQQLAYGTVQRARTLDHAIETLGRRPVRKLDPPVRAALRLGAYQLGFLDGVPAHAAVERVGGARAPRRARARGRLHERGHAAAAPTGSRTLLAAAARTTRRRRRRSSTPIRTGSRRRWWRELGAGRRAAR